MTHEPTARESRDPILGLGGARYTTPMHQLSDGWASEVI